MKLQWPLRYVGMTRRDARTVTVHIACEPCDPRTVAEAVRKELIRHGRRSRGAL